MRRLRSCAWVIGSPSSAGQCMIYPSRGPKLLPGLLAVWLIVATSYIFLTPISNNFLFHPLVLSLAGIATLGFMCTRPLASQLLLVPAGIWFAFVAYEIAVVLLRDAKSWPRTLVSFLFWPVISSLIFLSSKQHAVKTVFYPGAVVTVVILLTFQACALIALGRTPFESLPFWITSSLAIVHVVDGTGVIALAAHSLPPLLWLGAMWAASLSCVRDDLYLPPMRLRLLAGTLAISAAVIAWRRGILPVHFLVPIIMLIMWLLLRFKNDPEGPRPPLLQTSARVFACFFVAGSISMGRQSQVKSMLETGNGSVGTVLGIERPSKLSQADLESGTTYLISEGDQIADRNRIRASEIRFVTDADSMTDVLFGRGSGAAVDRDGIDSAMKLWQTELQDHGIYYWTGLAGLLLLRAPLFFSVRGLRRAFRSADSLRGRLFVSSIGASAFLIGDVTNPYRRAPEHMWPVFFPLMMAVVIFYSTRTQDHIDADVVETFSVSVGFTASFAIMDPTLHFEGLLVCAGLLGEA